jgi:hyaluronan synthase
MINITKQETAICTHSFPTTFTRKKIKPHKKQDSKGFSVAAVAVLATTILLLLGALFIFIQMRPYFESIHFERLNTSWGLAIVVGSAAILTIRLGFLLYLFVLSLRYKSDHSVSDTFLPTCTVIVPAYNEGALVWDTLISLANSNYPIDKLQIIAIDDGSQDDTWAWMQKAERVLGERLTLHRQPKNMGKRQALYRGFKIATGDVLVTVDSDSVVDKNTLRNLVTPFVLNNKCGAVAGNVRVLNHSKAIIPKMLNVSFTFSFEFVRSAQSVLGSVLCTPGALAAYRRDLVLACLPEWLNQTFMGRPSNIGEDRAMTNMILKQGFKVLFQRNAYVYTNIPEKYNKLYKMFVRWERSNVRENIAMTKFAFSNFREGAKTGTRIMLLQQWLKLTLSFPLTALMLYFACFYPILFFTSTLLGVFVFGSVQVFFYAKRYDFWGSVWAYVYGIFYTFTLFWITPYAIATAGKAGWLTRDLITKKGS